VRVRIYGLKQEGMMEEAQAQAHQRVDLGQP